MEGPTIDHLIDAGILRYQTSGAPDGEPVVFINSLGTDQRLWGAQREALARSHQVLTYDSRGQAGTNAPPASYTVADLGRDVVVLLDHLDLRSAHVVGISLGGLVGLWLGIHHADRVRSLLLANTAARIGSEEGWQERIDAVRARGMKDLAADVMERFFSPAFRRRAPATVAVFAERFGEHDLDGYVGQCAALRDSDLTLDARTCDVPTMVVAGSLDAATPAHQARWLHEHIPGSQLRHLDTGHLSNVEDPRGFNRILAEHLAAVRTQDRASRGLRP